MPGIEPFQLHFPFERNKQMSCTLKLTNETDSYIAFNVENTSPLPYCTQPQKGIMLPQSNCNVEITMQLQGKAPGYMHRSNELIVWSAKVNDCLAVEDMTTNIFINEADNLVDEVNLDVVFDTSESQETSDKTCEVSCQNTNFAKFAYSISGQPPAQMIFGCGECQINRRPDQIDFLINLIPQYKQ